MMTLTELVRPELEETFYNPGKVAYWLEHWADLTELAVPTAGTIRYLASESCDRHGFDNSCDPLHYLHIQTDIERAWVMLRSGRWSIEVVVTEYVMRGYGLRDIEYQLRIQHGVAEPAFKRACRQMAEYLGWQSSDNPA